ncbi:MAG: hypothetical protein ACR2MB_17790 [Acidimicrobiales bacterium]
MGARSGGTARRRRVDQAHRDAGYLPLGDTKESADAFLTACRAVWYWEREAAVDQT